MILSNSAWDWAPTSAGTRPNRHFLACRVCHDDRISDGAVCALITIAPPKRGRAGAVRSHPEREGQMNEVLEGTGCHCRRTLAPLRTYLLHEPNPGHAPCRPNAAKKPRRLASRGDGDGARDRR